MLFLLFKTNQIKISHEEFDINPYVMLCAILYHWYNLKNMRNTHGGVLILV